MINLTTAQVAGDDTWYGIAWAGQDLVATAVGSAKEFALASLRSCIPRGVAARLAPTEPAFITATVELLSRLERGEEEGKSFSLSREFVSEPMRRILTAAAAIPLGYVTTYGNIAKAAGSEARAVGRAMATNPLYPIVPCHRVVGADMSLVGYGGKQDRAALDAKLGRLKAETRGYSHEKILSLDDGELIVYPAEWVLEKAQAEDDRRAQVSRRRAEATAAERMQLRLF